MRGLCVSDRIWPLFFSLLAILTLNSAYVSKNTKCLHFRLTRPADIHFICLKDTNHSTSNICDQNDSFRFEMDSMTEVKAVSGKGRGLFATTIIPLGTQLGFYKGEILSWREYNKRYPNGDSEYTFLLNPSSQRRELIYIDAANPSTSNRLRFVNHDGERPNIITKIVYTDHLDHFDSFSDISRTRKDHNRNEILSSYSSKGSSNSNNNMTDLELVQSIIPKSQDSKSITAKKFPQVVFETMSMVVAGEELCFDYGPRYLASWKQS